MIKSIKIEKDDLIKRVDRLETKIQTFIQESDLQQLTNVHHEIKQSTESFDDLHYKLFEIEESQDSDLENDKYDAFQDKIFDLETSIKIAIQKINLQIAKDDEERKKREDAQILETKNKEQAKLLSSRLSSMVNQLNSILNELERQTFTSEEALKGFILKSKELRDNYQIDYINLTILDPSEIEIKGFYDILKFQDIVNKIRTIYYRRLDGIQPVQERTINTINPKCETSQKKYIPTVGDFLNYLDTQDESATMEEFIIFFEKQAESSSDDLNAPYIKNSDTYKTKESSLYTKRENPKSPTKKTSLSTKGSDVENKQMKQKVYNKKQINSSKFSKESLNTKNCAMCQNSHSLFHCQQFRQANYKDKINCVGDNNICSNCFGQSHILENCFSKGRCAICGAKHNLLLHTNQENKPETKDSSSVASISNFSSTKEHEVLPTALSKVWDPNGVPQTCRTILDSRSQSSITLTDSLRRQNLKAISTKEIIKGITGESVDEYEQARLNLDANFERKQNSQVSATVMQELDKTLSQTKLYKENRQMEMEKGNQEFQLNTVTHATASATFLATKSLLQLANDENKELHEPAEVIKTSFHINDLLSEHSDVESSKFLVNQFDSTFKKGDFIIRKRCLNNFKCLEDSNTSPKETKSVSIIQDQIKTLRIIWNFSRDEFQFSSSEFLTSKAYIKQTLQSYITKIFDPLWAGFHQLILFLSLSYKHSGRQYSSWDQELTELLVDQWKKWLSELPYLGQISITRCNLPTSYKSINLHCFADDCEKAYAAVIYRSAISDNGECITKLLTSKPTRNASIKTLSYLKPGGRNQNFKIPFKFHQKVSTNNIYSSILNQVKLQIFTHVQLTF